MSILRAELEPDNNRKSFYGKAIVQYTDDSKELYSYDTLVCRVACEVVTLFPQWSYSMTTVTHVACFLRQNGFDVHTKNDIEKLLSKKVLLCDGD